MGFEICKNPCCLALPPKNTPNQHASGREEFSPALPHPNLNTAAPQLAAQPPWKGATLGPRTKLPWIAYHNATSRETAKGKITAVTGLGLWEGKFCETLTRGPRAFPRSHMNGEENSSEKRGCEEGCVKCRRHSSTRSANKVRHEQGFEEREENIQAPFRRETQFSADVWPRQASPSLRPVLPSVCGCRAWGSRGNVRAPGWELVGRNRERLFVSDDECAGPARGLVLGPRLNGNFL